MPLGLYISVPFCKTKCTYCNFASGVFSKAKFEKYVDCVCEEINTAPQTAAELDAIFDRAADSMYFGGGTPTLLDVAQLQRLFVTIQQNFEVMPNAEITVECAPGTLSAAKLETLVESGVNRVSLGVQSFVDREAASVGRLHKSATVLDDIARLRSAGISNINVDLIAGLPHQTADSWRESLDVLIDSGVPHASVYMLEVDGDSRLGRELLAGGQKYHAHFVPDEDLTADLYEIACERLNSAGIQQYEISNFARAGFESRHNIKYWTRQPYFGFGVDAHSMLPMPGTCGAVRFSNADALENYISGAQRENTRISREAALQEEFFLGLRMNRGVDLTAVAAEYAGPAMIEVEERTSQPIQLGLLERSGSTVRLTPRGRLLSNEVFESFIGNELASVTR